MDHPSHGHTEHLPPGHAAPQVPQADRATTNPSAASHPGYAGNSGQTDHAAGRIPLLRDLAHRFTYHPPKDDQAARYAALRDQARELAVNIVHLTPPSREQSLAVTHLEEAIFWANASIARHE